MIPGFEILADAPMIERGRRMLQALADAKPADAEVTTAYRGEREVLVLYGAGAEWRQRALYEHKARGGQVVCLDLAYWDKKDRMRVAVGGMHPTPEQIEATYPADRPHPKLRDDYDPRGPIVVIGMGRKSREQHKFGGPSWEMRRLNETAARFPGRRVLYRKKGRKPDGVVWKETSGTDIEHAIRGASLVICRHSNVAVDACIAGIPVECEGGAALWLYRRLSHPDASERLDFLRRLASWQYGLHEAGAAWAWIRRALETA